MTHAVKFPKAVLPLIVCLVTAVVGRAQQAPSVGYVFPPGGKAGTTVNVKLGGYDWTPDVRFFVQTDQPERRLFYPAPDTNDDGVFKIQERVHLEVTAPPGEVILPGPPYWFGIKSFANDPPLPREASGRFVLPAHLPPGPIRWRVANANGASNCGIFIVSNDNEVIENEERREPQKLASLPVTISGRIGRIEEVDRYTFTAERTGLVTCELAAQRLGSDFNGVLEVYDAAGRLLIEEVDTEGLDPATTFAVEKGQAYTVAVRDIDHRGYRAYTYRLAITPGPRVLAAIPAAGQRGETQALEFIGIGLATGAAKLESVTRKIAFPASNDSPAFGVRLETEWGTAPGFKLLLSDLPEQIATNGEANQRLEIPAAITARLSKRDGTDRFLFSGSKGQMVNITAEARRFGSPLDLAVSVIGPDGKELATADDRPGTTDTALSATLPLDGDYQLIVSDMAGAAGVPTAIYRLVLEEAAPDFQLEALPLANVPIGEGAKFNLKVTRTGGFKEPITLSLAGLPQGVSVPISLVVPPTVPTFTIPLNCAEDAPAEASLAQIIGVAKVGNTTLTRVARAPMTGDLTMRDPVANSTPSVLVAATIKPPFKVICVEADGGRRVHRGATHLAELKIERDADFTGDILLDMAATQSRHRQGIRGPALTIAPTVTSVAYPVFLPEWLETTRTSRLAVVGMAKVADPRGTLRYVLAPMQGQVTMSIEGALLKLVHTGGELAVQPGQSFAVPLKVARTPKLAETVRLELIVPQQLVGVVKAEAIVLAPKQENVELQVTTDADGRLAGNWTFTVRASALRDNHPIVSEAAFEVEFVTGPARSASANR